MPNDDNELKVVMICSLFSGSAAKMITHPLDTIKSKLQVNSKNEYISIRNLAIKTIEKEGIAGLYKGLPVNLIGAIPGTVLHMTSYEFSKKYLIEKKYFKSDFMNYFISGMFAELISCIVFVPVDIIKERRQVQSNMKSFEYKSDFDALKQICNREGIRGIYKAYGATLMSYGPYSAFSFTFFEKIKGLFVNNDSTAYLKKIKKEEEVRELTFLQSIFCSSVSGGLASVITNPLDLVKMRMQVQRADINHNKDTALYKNLFHGLFVVIRNEGIRGLFKGSLARALYMIPTTCLIFSFIEISKPKVRKLI